MSHVQKLLFVCSHNLQRSLTAERIFEGMNGYEVKSAGTRREARTRVNQQLVEWADVILAMEQPHVEWLRRRFKEELVGKRLICLQIPDRYGYMSFELAKLLKERLSVYFPLP